MSISRQCHQQCHPQCKKTAVALTTLSLLPGCTDSAGTVHAVDTLYVDYPSSPQLRYVCAELSSSVAPLPVIMSATVATLPLPAARGAWFPTAAALGYSAHQAVRDESYYRKLNILVHELITLATDGNLQIVF